MTTTNDVARTVSRQPIDKLFMFHNELSIHPDWPWEQRRALAVFRSKVSNQVSGHFDRAFWNTVALQAAHQEKPVKYAILALSGLVEHVQAEGSPNDISSRVVEEGAFALQNYNEAIRELTSSAQNGCLKIDVCLITCLLFVSFEVRTNPPLGGLFDVYEKHADLTVGRSTASGSRSSTHQKWVKYSYRSPAAVKGHIQIL